MRVFVDANILVSGLVFKGNESRVMELGDIGAVKLFTSTKVFEEVARVIRREEFGSGRTEVENMLSYLQRVALIVEKPNDEAMRAISLLLDDKKDAHVWAGLVRSDADFLLTGDKELLKKVDRAIGSKDLLQKLEDLGLGIQ